MREESCVVTTYKYIAEDGREFSNKKECERYEASKVETKNVEKMETPYKYRIVITSEREDYDDLSIYANNPEYGFIEAIYWFDYLWQIENLLCKFEGLFYILSIVENNNAELNLISSKADNVIGYGVIEGIGGYPSIDIYEYERKQYEQYSND